MSSPPLLSDFIYYRPKPGGGGEPVPALLELRDGWVRLWTDAGDALVAPAPEVGFAENKYCVLHLVWRDQLFLLYHRESNVQLSPAMAEYLRTNKRFSPARGPLLQALAIVGTSLFFFLSCIASFSRLASPADADSYLESFATGSGRVHRAWIRQLIAAGSPRLDGTASS